MHAKHSNLQLSPKVTPSPSVSMSAAWDLINESGQEHQRLKQIKPAFFASHPSKHRADRHGGWSIEQANDRREAGLHEFSFHEAEYNS